MGAMENAGCVTLRDEYLPRSRQTGSFYECRATVILHEMAHMWFGDLVTMKWWDDLWLNESFAEWACYHAAAEATQFTEAWTGFTNARKNWALRQDQLPSTHPIAADNYDLAGGRGQLRRHHLRQGRVGAQAAGRLGRAGAFLAGLRQYFQRPRLRQHRVHRPAQGAREDLGPRARLVGQGVAADRRASTRSPPSSSSTTTAPTRRSPSRRPPTADYPTLRRHRLGIGLYDDGRPGRRPARAPHARRGRRRRASDRRSRAGRPAPARPAAAQRRRPHLRQDPPRRALAGDRWSAASAARRLARPRAVLGRRLGHDPRRRDVARPTSSSSCWPTSAPRPTRSALSRSRRSPRRRSTPYSAPANRAALRERWEQGLRELLEDGRARQRPPADVRPRLRRRRSQRRGARRPRGRCSTARYVIDGLAVDTDLRWTLLTGLARPAAPTPTRIDAELDRDNTISGQENAAAALALPGPRPRPRPRPGSRRWCATTSPTRPHAGRPLSFMRAGQEDAARAVRRPLPRRAPTPLGAARHPQGVAALEYIFPRAAGLSRAARQGRRLARDSTAGQPGRQALRARGPATWPAPSPPRPRTPSRRQ